MWYASPRRAFSSDQPLERQRVNKHDGILEDEMANKIMVGLGALLALVIGFAPDLIPANIAAIILVLGGIVYGALEVDASDASGYLICTIAVVTLAGSDALGGIPAIGMQLDGAVGAIATGMNGGVATVLAMGIVNRLKG